jgi:hypothetical protein
VIEESRIIIIIIDQITTKLQVFLPPIEPIALAFVVKQWASASQQ